MVCGVSEKNKKIKKKQPFYLTYRDYYYCYFRCHMLIATAVSIILLKINIRNFILSYRFFFLIALEKKSKKKKGINVIYLSR